MKMIHKISTITAVLAAAAGTASPAIASNQIDLRSEVFVERAVTAKDGSRTVVLQSPARVTPGDSLVFVLTYRNSGDAPARDFVITNPMPAAVAFQRTAEGAELVSIDGGRNWGRLSDLRVAAADGSSRSAVPEDVTHLRWRMPDAVAAGASGKLSFRGVVR